MSCQPRPFAEPLCGRSRRRTGRSIGPPYMETIQREPTDQAACPHCGVPIRFYRFGGMGNICPHFYCDTCSNVFHRESDFERIYHQERTRQLLEQIAATLPSCPCGGRFAPEASPKCPTCHQDLSHQASVLERLNDPYAILVTGACLVLDTS